MNNRIGVTKVSADDGLSMKNTDTENLNYTYMLRCADNSLYTGWTNDLGKRLRAHNAGTGAKYTGSRRPVQLVYFEIFSSKNEAMSREFHLKRMKKDAKERLIGELSEEKIREIAALNEVCMTVAD